MQKLAGAGSSRRYYRLFSRSSVDEENAERGKDASAEDAGKKPQSLIATVGANEVENEVFCRLSGFLADAGVRVPRVFKAAPGCYLQTDHGDRALFDLIKDWHNDPSQHEDTLKEGLRRAIYELVKIQTVDDSIFTGRMMAKSFSERQVKWDLNYFKYDFLKPSGIEPDEELLEDDFERMATHLAGSVPDSIVGFMYRDFQSRNILLEDDGVTLIDFQGGRRGPLIYDIVSLLWQAKARFSETIRSEMLDYYIERLAQERGTEVEKEILRLLPDFKLFRALQVLGAYGFRGIVEHKAHFIESISDGLENLETLIDEGVLSQYPELERCCRLLAAGKEKYRSPARGRLRVEVFSFSYKKGYPEDWSGNGGGYMFDCRWMHNPGRYKEYQQLTGRDTAVMEFLESRGEVQKFLEGAEMLTVPAVECYSRRGFTNLQIGFGCTGGQHRSVYCAEQLARSLALRFPDVMIELKHREQGITEEFNK
ncbi:MAG: phosphotransferase [Muribaculaceae bacterium]|nr:phosphotransferase [Muribaculaceae bacterium]MDE6558898.1 phosphotransferase [Muribaculaceae bacterium]